MQNFYFDLNIKNKIDKLVKVDFDSTSCNLVHQNFKTGFLNIKKIRTSTDRKMHKRKNRNRLF